MAAIVLAFLMLFQRAPAIAPGTVEGILQTMDGTPAVAVRVAVFAVPKASTNPDDSLNYFNLDREKAFTLTDNEGHFLLELPPDRYYVVAGVPGQGTYFPGEPNIRGATIVTVNSNQTTGDLDFALKQRFGAKLSGMVKADMTVLGSRTATLTGGPLADLIEVPVGSDGNFTFGELPTGTYLLSMYPPTSGIASLRVTVGDKDVTGEALVPLPTQKVTGRIVTKKGPIPITFLGFASGRHYIEATINPDGTFTADLHAAAHQVEFRGLPVGYSVASVRMGSTDVSKGIPVGTSDVSGIVITLDTPEDFASVRGKISGLDPSRYSSTRVEMKGPIVGALQVGIRADGTFEFPVVVPGSYSLTLTSVPELSPVLLNLDSTNMLDISVSVPRR